MPLQTAVVIGATGLIGGYVVQELLKDETFERVVLLVRKEYPIKHPKLTARIVDFNNPADYKDKLGAGNAIFSCVGTTQNKVDGDKEAYRKIDFDIPVTAAKLGKEAGFSTFLLVSAVGANAKSANFYLHLKGEVDEAVSSFGLDSVHILRPSVLLGKRNEYRFGEKIAQVVMSGISFLLRRSLRKYNPIEASIVAKAMLAAAKSEMPGDHIYEYDRIMALAEEKT